MNQGGVEETMTGILPLIGAIGAPGLLVLVVLMIFTGRLVPRSFMNERMKDKDDLITDLRNAYAVLKENNDLLRLGNETAVHISQATAEAVGARVND